ncbi:hypothetical protein GQ457_13G007600 [Hibiscus cannabinus]
MNVAPLKDLIPNEPKVMNLELLKKMNTEESEREKSRGQLEVELTYKLFKEEEIPKTFQESRALQRAPNNTPDGGQFIKDGPTVSKPSSYDLQFATITYNQPYMSLMEQETLEGGNLTNVIINKRFNDRYHLIDSKMDEFKLNCNGEPICFFWRSWQVLLSRVPRSANKIADGLAKLFHVPADSEVLVLDNFFVHVFFDPPVSLLPFVQDDLFSASEFS